MVIVNHLMTVIVNHLMTVIVNHLMSVIVNHLNHNILVNNSQHSIGIHVFELFVNTHTTCLILDSDEFQRMSKYARVIPQEGY
jgi:hypothetical protein